MKSLMTHVVAGYPTLDDTRHILTAMVQHRVWAIEIQIPFSDPLADGPVLMHANDRAVQQAITRDHALELIRDIDFRQTHVFIMCYYQSLFHKNPSKFITDAVAAGCHGFIVPDLPFDSPDLQRFLKNIPEL